MKEKLIELFNNSKSKYYNYPVAAILECNDGTLIPGVNVETSSPAAGICAERCAIYAAIARGYNKDDFKAIHLACKNDSEITPCFICRQTLVDYTDSDFKIYSYYSDKVSVYTIDDLCVKIFSEDNL